MLRNDLTPRTKKGQPPQSTTGVARANCSHVLAAWDNQAFNGLPGM